MGGIGFDDELRRHNEVLRRVAGVRPRDHVLDIGCGTGQTTREAARAASEGSAFGVDVSGVAVERAREVARREGIGNVDFACADAQVDLPVERFDLVISRFGVMFFGDPVAAFANIRRALRPGGRLAMIVWRSRERNEWAVVVQRALGVSAGSVPDAFSLGEAEVVEGVLGAAGFVDVALTDVEEPVYYGPNVDVAVEWVRGFSTTRSVLDGLEPGATEEAVGRLRETLGAYLGDDGVWLGSRAWVVTARC
ncbi:methyltransferase family protein [Actinomadura pelletieri DSM 43383]|uniref:Methyltransferase family protein n=1 Tax=Actinomadura pelletieri DSM 43383 TaxID=1120940 RepID=A0A495QTR0_9ACTN|nr:class I SAM-dependent methyltransferase [Actinomadura pelletieri]RKS76869.1 methyltransferase family protein [Actinomadura pelletieri DSM 43383]